MIKPPIILFDGVCNLCNGAVQFVIRHDTRGKFKFAALQSTAGKNLLGAFHLPDDGLNSIVLIQDDLVFTKSGAALRVAKQLKGLTGLLYGFIIVPAFIRDAVYDYIARNRYKWFGERSECMIPDAELQSRFLN